MEPNFHQDFPAESRDILPVPYLEHVAEPLALRPGRQLFVDDWLIAGTDCERIFHPLVPYPGNPVLKPETELELDRFQCPLAVPFNDGVWYDPADRLYKFFYHAGWFHGTAYAVSRDGIRWERPNLGIVGNSNQLIPPRPGYERDGGLVWLDQHTEDPAERWKMFLYFRHETGEGGELYTSADGIHWNFRTTAGPCDDNSSFYYDPFLRRWIFSIRNSMGNNGRARAWLARRDFIAPPWTQEEPINWARADSLDPFEQETGMEPQLYDLNATPYESLMLGIFAIFHGPENNVCERLGIPKRNDLHFAFSRDGYHWSRPAGRTPALACTRREGDWDRGYLHAAGGICLVFRDKLRFYYGGWSGKSALAPGEKGNSSRGAFAMYAGGAPARRIRFHARAFHGNRHHTPPASPGAFPADQRGSPRTPRRTSGPEWHSHPRLFPDGMSSIFRRFLQCGIALGRQNGTARRRIPDPLSPERRKPLRILGIGSP